MKAAKFATTIRIKPTILLFCILVLCVLAYYGISVYEKRRTLEPEVYKLLKACPPAEYYADSEVIYLLDETVKEVFIDGKANSSVHKVFKILKEKGRDYAAYKVHFFSNKETISFLYAKTITPEGKVIPLKKGALKAVAPDEDEYYRVLSISMPKARVGSVIDWKYVIEKKKPEIEGKFADNYIIQSREPILLSRYKLVVPEDMELKYLHVNPLKETTSCPHITQQSGKKIYTWEYRNVHPILNEDDMPSVNEIASKILVSTFDSWEECFRWEREKIKGKTEPDEAIKEKVAELTRGLTSPRDKIAAIFGYVAREIRYSSLETFSSSGHEPDPAALTFGSKVGDCKDKTSLLISMLKVAGIPAYYVSVPTHDMWNLIKDFPSPFQFNHAIVAAKEGESYQFVDPTAEYHRADYLPAGDQNRDVLIFKDQETIFARTPLEKAKDNAVVKQQHIKIKTDGAIEAEVKFILTGSKEASNRSAAVDSSPAETKKEIEEIRGEISPWARLLEYSYTDPLDFQKPFTHYAKYRAPDYCKKAGDILVFRVPSIGRNCKGIDKEKRQYPISFWARSYSKNEVGFNIPDGYEIYHLPVRVRMVNPYFEYRSSYRSNGDKVSYESEFIREAVEIPVKEYASYRKCCQEVAKSRERYVLFRRKKR